MASPPFNINQAIPGDDDIVSQHPVNARAYRDTVESWLLVQGNVNGRSDKIYYDFTSAPTKIASVTSVWADSLGYLQMAKGTGTTEEVGVPVGTVLPFAGLSAPVGYLFCSGQNASRTTFARLFSVIGTTYGSGDGSTTFGLPDIRGRTIFGKDDMGGSAAGRLTNSFTNGISGTSLGGVGGHEAHFLTTAQLAQHLHGVSIVSDPGSNHGHGVIDNTNAANAPHDHSVTIQTLAGISLSGGGGSTILVPSGGSGNIIIATGSSNANHSHGLTFTTSGEAAHTHAVVGNTQNTGSGAGHNNLPPGMVLNMIIKY